MMNTNFTQLEKQILRNYLPKQSADDFGQEPMKIQDIGNYVWTNENVDLSNETIKGVVGSLVKKGILKCYVAEVVQRVWLDEVFRDNEDLLNKVINLTI